MIKWLLGTELPQDYPPLVAILQRKIKLINKIKTISFAFIASARLGVLRLLYREPGSIIVLTEAAQSTANALLFFSLRLDAYYMQMMALECSSFFRSIRSANNLIPSERSRLDERLHQPAVSGLQSDRNRSQQTGY